MNGTVVPELTDVHRRVLLDIARDAVGVGLATGAPLLPDPVLVAAELRRPAATFVTLERDALLLGCIGSLEAARPLAVGVAHHAFAAAFTDPRLPTVDHDDYVAMSIKISVLSELEPFDAHSLAELAAGVRPGIDGLVVDTGGRRATFLPSVWAHLHDVDVFLATLWRKVGLRPGSWPAHTRCSRYTTDEFSDAGPRGPVEADGRQLA